MKLTLFLPFYLFLIFLLGCNSKDDSPPPVQILNNQSINFVMDDIFKFSSPFSNMEMGSRLMTIDLPKYSDLVYEIALWKNDNYPINEKLSYFTYNGIKDAGILNYNLEKNVPYYFELRAYYILDPNEINNAIADSLITKEVMVTNSNDINANVDTTVIILDYPKNNSNFKFGTHNLSLMFGRMTDDFIPNPEDTITYLIKSEELYGPKLLDIQIDNTLNATISGEITLEFDGGNSDPIEFSVDNIPDDIFVVSDWLKRVELFYNSPSGVKTSFLIREDLNNLKRLTYYIFEVRVPEVYTDENGEYLGSSNFKTQNLELIFSGNLYGRDTLVMGE